MNMLDRLDHAGRLDIKSLTPEELGEEMEALGERSFRAKQIFEWLHEKGAEDFASMTNLSAALRNKLKERFGLTALEVVGERISSIDGTRKYLFRLEDGNVTATAIPSASHPRPAAGWAAGSARPLWTGWRGICGPQRCWIRFTGSGP